MPIQVTVLSLKGWVGPTWTILAPAASKWMSACSTRASIWSACRAENGGQSWVSAQPWLANVAAATGSCTALGLLFYYFMRTLFFSPSPFSFHFTQVNGDNAPGDDVRAGRADALQMSHVMFVVGQQYLRNMFAVKKWLPWIQSEAYWQELHTLVCTAHKRQPKGRALHHSWRWQMCSPHAAASPTQPGPVIKSFICLFFLFVFLLALRSNKPVLATHSFALFGCRCDIFLLVLAQCGLCWQYVNSNTLQHVRHVNIRVTCHIAGFYMK